MAALAFPLYVLVSLFPGVLQGATGASSAPAPTTTERAGVAGAAVARGSALERPIGAYRPQPTATGAARYSPLDAAPPPTVTAPERPTPAPTSAAQR